MEILNSSACHEIRFFIINVCGWSQSSRKHMFICKEKHPSILLICQCAGWGVDAVETQDVSQFFIGASRELWCSEDRMCWVWCPVGVWFRDWFQGLLAAVRSVVVPVDVSSDGLSSGLCWLELLWVVQHHRKFRRSLRTRADQTCVFYCIIVCSNFFWTVSIMKGFTVRMSIWNVTVCSTNGL